MHKAITKRGICYAAQSLSPWKSAVKPFFCLTFVWSDFLSANERGWSGCWYEKQSKSACAQRQRDTGAQGWLWTNSGCAHSKHSRILHYLNCGSTGNYSAGTEFSFPSISHSNLPPQKTACFSLFLCGGMNTSGVQNQLLWIFSAIISSIFRKQLTAPEDDY